MCVTIELLIVQRPHVEFGGLTRDGVKLNALYLASIADQFAYSIEILIEILGEHWYAAQVHQHRLNDNRATFARFEDVIEHAVERNSAAVDLLIASHRSGIEFGPYFTVVFVKLFKSALHVGSVVQRHVCQHNQLNPGEFMGVFQIDDHPARIFKVRIHCRFAVTAERDVVEATLLGRHSREFIALPDLAARHPAEHRIEFVSQPRRVNAFRLWTIRTIDLTVNAIPVAHLVGIEVDAYPDYEFEGKITAFSPATGARFSLLPPDNATGNFVKTVQRLPVKIEFSDENDKEKLDRLRSGMNVLVDVHLK